MDSEPISIEKPKKKRWKRWLLRTIYTFVGIYFIIDVLLFFVATPLLKNYLQDKISEKTNGLFSVNFEKISIELGTRRIALKKFELLADTNIYNKLSIDKKNTPALYNISCSSVELWRMSIFNLWSNNILKAKELKLIDLVIELKKLPAADSSKTESRDFVHDDLFPAISDYLTEIKINEIKVENGKFNLTLNKSKLKQTTHIGYVSISLYKFLLNQNEFLNRKRLFFSDDLQINIDEYRINLSDKIHFIYAQDLNISSKKSKLTAKYSGILPINQSDKFLDKLRNNYFKIHAPNIEFDHFNIYELYFNNDINIGKISINKPKIEIFNLLETHKEKKDEISKSKEIDLSRLIAGKLNSINVDTFKIDLGSLDFYYSNSRKSPVYKANSISLALYNFKLDDYSFNDQSKLFYSDNINLQISGFSTLLPDKLHALNVASIQLSSFDKLFKAIGIKLKPIALSESKFQQRMNIFLPYLEISGTDFYRLYHNRILDISNLTIGNADIDLNLLSKNKRNEREPNDKNFLSIITSNYLKQLSIRNFKLKESKFKINNQLDSLNFVYQGEATFGMSKFFLDKSSFNADQNNLFYSDQFNLWLKNYSQDLKDGVHKLYSKSIEVSTTDSIIEIADLRIHKKETNEDILHQKIKKWMIDFKLIQLSMKGIDINKAFNDSILIARSISVFRPEIQIENNLNIKKELVHLTDSNISNYQNDSLNRQLSADELSLKNLLALYFFKIHINALNIEDADFALSEVDSLGKKDLNMKAKISARLNEFQLVPKDSLHAQTSFADNIAFRVTDYFSKLFDKKYQIKIKQARFSSKDSVFSASLFRFFPTPEHEKSEFSNNLWTIYIPEISTHKTDISQLMNENIMDVGFLLLKNPSFANTQKVDKINRGQQINPLNGKKSFPLKKIKFSGMVIENGVFGVLKDQFNFSNLSLNSKLNLQTQAFELDSLSISNPHEFISDLDAHLILNDFIFQVPDSIHIIRCNKVEINTGLKTIKGDSLYFFPTERFIKYTRKPGLNEFVVPKFGFDGFRFDRLILDKSLISGSLMINEPGINVITKDKSEKNKFILSDLILYDKIKKTLKEIDIRLIHVDEAKLNLLSEKNPQNEPKILNHLSADIFNLVIDSLYTNRDKILNADDVNFRIKDYDYQFLDNLYSLNLKDVEFSTGKKTISARSVNINPQMGREAYASFRQKETNLMYLKTAEIIVKGFDFKNYIDFGNFIAEQAEINNAQFHTYKNKQYPLDSIIKIALPLDYILKSKKLIKIDTVNIRNSYIGHEILGKNARENGYLDFTNINGNISQITNDPTAISKNINTNIVASGYLMDKSLITISLHFPLNSKFGEYYYGGELDTFNMADVNPLLENLFFVSVTDGIINNMNFNISANEDYAEGKLKMTYHNLKIDLLNKKKTDSLETEKRGLFSMVANSIIRNSNPKYKNGFVREGRIYFERNIYKSVFNYWAFSILSGMQSILGFKSKQLKERLRIEKLSDRFSKKFNKKTAKIDHKRERIQKKQIDKEIKQEQRNRKKTGRRDKKSPKQNQVSDLLDPRKILSGFVVSYMLN